MDDKEFSESLFDPFEPEKDDPSLEEEGTDTDRIGFDTEEDEESFL